MQKNSNKTIEDDLWSTISFYSTRADMKVTKKEYDIEKCQKASCSLENAVELLYTDASGRFTEDYIPQKKTMTKIGLNKIGKKVYLTDNGTTFASINRRVKMTKRAFADFLKTIESDYDLSILNEELCIEIRHPDYLADCYRNLSNVIARVNYLFQFVQ